VAKPGRARRRPYQTTACSGTLARNSLASPRRQSRPRPPCLCSDGEAKAGTGTRHINGGVSTALTSNQRIDSLERSFGSQSRSYPRLRERLQVGLSRRGGVRVRREKACSKRYKCTQQQKHRQRGNNLLSYRVIAETLAAYRLLFRHALLPSRIAGHLTLTAEGTKYVLASWRRPRASRILALGCCIAASECQSGRHLRHPCFQPFDLNPATMTFAGKILFKFVVVLPRGPLALGSCSSES
jgi:hypothetical protein